MSNTNEEGADPREETADAPSGDQPSSAGTGRPDPPLMDPSLERVREILFGDQKRKLSKKLDRMGDNVRRELQRLREGFRQDVDHLRDLVEKKSRESRAESLQEKEHRENAVEDLSQGIDSLATTSQQSLLDLEIKIQTRLDELFSRLQNQHEDLSARLNKLVGDVDQRLGRVQEEKVSRSVLSSMFQKIADEMLIGGEEEPGKTDHGDPGESTDGPSTEPQPGVQ